MVVRKKVKVEDFKKIASNYEFYIWNFLQREQNETTLGMFSYFDDSQNEIKTNLTKYTLDGIEIPYFESYTEESMDFLLDFNIPHSFLFRQHDKNKILEHKRKFSPIFLGFNKYKLIGGSNEACYCPDYLIELVFKMNPEFILNSKFD